MDGVEMDFGFSFNATPTIDMVLYFRGTKGHNTPFEGAVVGVEDGFLFVTSWIQMRW